VYRHTIRNFPGELEKKKKKKKKREKRRRRRTRKEKEKAEGKGTRYKVSKCHEQPSKSSFYAPVRIIRRTPVRDYKTRAVRKN
jgi:hypothetical protein